MVLFAWETFPSQMDANVPENDPPQAWSLRVSEGESGFSLWLLFGERCCFGPDSLLDSVGVCQLHHVSHNEIQSLICPLHCPVSPLHTAVHWWAAMSNKLHWEARTETTGRSDKLACTQSQNKQCKYWTSQEDANLATVGKCLRFDSSQSFCLKPRTTPWSEVYFWVWICW